MRRLRPYRVKCFPSKSIFGRAFRGRTTFIRVWIGVDP